MHNAANRFNEIGRAGRAHGLDGAVRVLPEREEYESLFKVGILLTLKDRQGLNIPLRIERVQRSIKGSTRLFFVKFDRINNRMEAESLLDRPLLADLSLSDVPEKEALEDIRGFMLTDPSGLKANVVSVFDNPAHRIIEAEHNGNHFMVPWVDEYVLQIDNKSRRIRCQNLESLINL
ncbi:MAG: hypothetical protein WD094_02295 [Balneolaceae bacterium]